MLRVRARVGLSVMLCCAVALAGPWPAAAQTMAPETAVKALPAYLDARVDRVMRTFEVPGLALAVVKDGRVLTARGYGLKKMGEPARVDADTLFCIASNTKVFTATALALLVEEGKLAPHVLARSARQGGRGTHGTGVAGHRLQLRFRGSAARPRIGGAVEHAYTRARETHS